MSTHISSRAELMNSDMQKRGGQAIVMVTLALIAMCGMMGLAVDLGWSFFVQKQAQAAADGAALAAVQEVYKRQGGIIPTLTCGTGATATYCAATPTDCATIMSDTNSNLYNGCLYASNNGFTAGGQGGKQNITMAADVTTPIPTVPNVTVVKYWVTARTVQSIPQLFSAVLGNSTGTISAIATAGIAGIITPGSFYGLNQRGDCLSDASGLFNCGVDIDISGAGQSACTNINGTSAGVTAKVCAPSGLYLASDCNGTAQAGCGSGSNTTSGSNWAGQTQGGSANVWSATTNQIRGTGAVNNPSQFSPTPTNGSSFADPMLNKAQPPLLTPSSPLPTCGVLNGAIPTGTLGPYQYYSYTMVGGVPTPNGAALTVGNGTSVTFSSSGGCGFANAQFAAGASQVNGSFPVTVFYGGLDINGNSGTHVTFGAGQYVMAGTILNTDSVQNPAAVFNMRGGTVTGDSTVGTVFVLTDKSYDGALANQTSASALTGMPTLYQGYTQIKNTDVTLYGVNASAPAALTSVHQNMLFWQDRRNSNINLDPTTGAALTSPVQLPPSSYNRTPTSPQFIIDDGNAALNLRGVFYQPRGAWINLKSGGGGVNNSPLQVVTGALYSSNGSGSASVTLQGPSAPIIKYVTALIQ